MTNRSQTGQEGSADWREILDGLYGQALRSCPIIFVAGIVMGFALNGGTGRILAIVFCSLGLILLAGCLAGRSVLRRQTAQRRR